MRGRRLLYDSIGCLLTPIIDIDDCKQWLAVQLQACDNTDSILFIYRLDDASKVNVVKPYGFNEKVLYKVEYWDGRNDMGCISGEKLMEEGIIVEIPEKCDAVAIIFTPI